MAECLCFYVCWCVCILMCVLLHTDIKKYARKQAPARDCLCVRVCASVCLCFCVYLFVCVFVCLNVRVPICVLVFFLIRFFISSVCACLRFLKSWFVVICLCFMQSDIILLMSWVFWRVCVYFLRLKRCLVVMISMLGFVCVTNWILFC